MLQDFESIEILCVDDGSTDSSSSIVEKLSIIDERIVKIQSTHRGTSHARNLGLEYARGKYVYFVDSDDSLKSRSIKKMYSLCEKKNLDTLIFNAKILGSRNNWKIKKMPNKNKFYPDFKYDDVFHISGIIPFVWNHFIKRSILINNGICFNECLYLGEDQNFVLKYFKHVHRVKIIKSRFYRHTLRTDSSYPNELTLSQNDYHQHVLMVEDIIQYLGNSIDTSVAEWAIDTIYYSHKKIHDGKYAYNEETKKIFEKLQPLIHDKQRLHIIQSLTYISDRQYL